MLDAPTFVTPEFPSGKLRVCELENHNLSEVRSMGKSPFLNGNLTINVSFSIAMLNYETVRRTTWAMVSIAVTNEQGVILRACEAEALVL